MTSAYSLAISFGGTKIALGIVHLESMTLYQDRIIRIGWRADHPQATFFSANPFDCSLYIGAAH